MERPLDVARELERRDDELAAAIADLAALELESERLRARAAEIESLRARLPEERAVLSRRLDDAREELAVRHTDARSAEAELELAMEKGDAGRVEAARRDVVRTRDAASSAEKRAERLEQLVDELERQAAVSEREAPSLEERAARAASRLAAIARLAAPDPPEPGLAAVVAWAARARASLFVARSGLERERESVVREANELGAAVLGEPLFASSVALVRTRLEEAP